MRYKQHKRHERSKPLYRGVGTKEKEIRQFRERYGEKGKAVYGAVVGKVYREKYGRSYSGGPHPTGRKGYEVPSKRHLHRRNASY
jgi:hypothetical protein